MTRYYVICPIRSPATRRQGHRGAAAVEKPGLGWEAATPLMPLGPRPPFAGSCVGQRSVCAIGIFTHTHVHAALYQTKGLGLDADGGGADRAGNSYTQTEKRAGSWEARTICGVHYRQTIAMFTT